MSDNDVPIAFVPADRPLSGQIRPPGSKSLTNRALICAAMADGVSTLRHVLVSEDTEVMIEAWRSLGVEIELLDAGDSCRVVGCGGNPPRRSGNIFVANSGTSIRFLAAALAACGGLYTLDGVPRMRQRPIGDLLEALKSWGVRVESLNAADPDCPPVRIDSDGLSGGSVTVAGDVSSQFLSGLMMAAPYASARAEIAVKGELVSRPYVDMTAAVMKSFGADVRGDGQAYAIEAPRRYRPTDYAVEPDASAASYYLAAAAITGGRVTVEGLGRESLQGDVRFADVLRRMGCRVEVSADQIELQADTLRGIDVDMGDISDTVQTLAVVAAFADGATRVRGVAHNRFKETDRIADLARELRRVGLTVDEHEDGLTVHPGPIEPATVRTYNDHRMAMSLSLLGLRIPELWVENPACTAKTYPHYFEEMRRCFGLRTVQRT